MSKWMDAIKSRAKVLAVGVWEVVQREGEEFRAQLLATRPQVSNPAMVRVGGYVFTRDPKAWVFFPSYATREQAIMAALTVMDLPPGSIVYTGKVGLVDATVAAPSFVDYLEWFADSLAQTHGIEIATKFREETQRVSAELYKEATATLRQLVTAFLAKTTFALYQVGDVLQHVIPEAMTEEKVDA